MKYGESQIKKKITKGLDSAIFSKDNEIKHKRSHKKHDRRRIPKFQYG